MPVSRFGPPGIARRRLLFVAELVEVVDERLFLHQNTTTSCARLPHSHEPDQSRISEFHERRAR